MAIEDLEWAKRKIQAFLMILFGLLIMFGSFLGLIIFSYYFPIQIAILGFICGGILFVYGVYVSNKVSHVVWTKQAIREMMDKEYLADSDLLKRIETSNENKKNLKKCPYCNELNDIDNSFCENCGKKLDEKKTNNCKDCGNEYDTSDSFCAECGKKIKDEGKS